MDGGAWWAAVHGVAKSRTQLSDFTFTFHFHALEKEMATHSSILSLENPWGRTESLKRLSSSSKQYRQGQNSHCPLRQRLEGALKITNIVNLPKSRNHASIMAPDPKQALNKHHINEPLQIHLKNGYDLLHVT